MSHLLALDQGTTSSRAVVFDESGHAIAESRKGVRVFYPQPGWVEQDAAALAESQTCCAEEALAQVGLAAADVTALGIVNQRETTILWDRSTGQPIGPAIVWQDRRTAAECVRLGRQGLEPLVRERTGLVLDPYFSATKIAWLLDQVPGARRQAARGALAFGNVDAWLIWHLTGGRVHATDVTNASRTLLFNIHTLTWDTELLDAFGIPAALLPTVRPSAGDFGTAQLGSGAIAIRGVAGDQHAALFGQGCLRAGQAKNTYGTGAFIVVNTGATPSAADGVLTTLAWELSGRPPVYAMEGSIFNAGAAVQWLHEALGLIDAPAQVERLARQVEDTNGVLILPAFTGLGAPFWKPEVRGTMLGLTRGTRAAHLARATLEAVAYRTRDVIDAIGAATGEPISELRVDGGGAANDLLMQIQADILGLPVLRPPMTETTARGAALFAGVGAGVVEPSAAAGRWVCERRFEPGLADAERERGYTRWRRACACAIECYTETPG